MYTCVYNVAGRSHMQSRTIVVYTVTLVQQNSLGRKNKCWYEVNWRKRDQPVMM